MRKHILVALVALAAVVGLGGCGASKDVLLIQDVTPGDVIAQIEEKPIRVQPGDEIMVYVSCSDPEMAARLSLVSGNRPPEYRDNVFVSSTSAVMLPYTVSDKGDIAMPEIGTVHVAGLTRQEIAKLIERKITDARLVKDNAVNITVQFANLTFTTLGEVGHTGTYNITKDNLTLLEALAISGDMTIFGRRDAVWVLREMPDGSRRSYKVDLRNSADFMQSPAYTIQQNDVIYVQPNKVRAGQSTLNENTFKSVGFWTTLASLSLTIATLVVTITR